MRRKEVLKNMIASLWLQIVTLISGFIIPKIIISHFGSDINGLISSINQFLNYIQLIEGGLGSVILAALYKPLSEQDEKKISGIVNAATGFFRKIGIFYIVYAILVGIIYPRIINVPLSKAYIFALVLVLAINLFVQYYFSITYKLLLTADRKGYFVSIVQMVIVALNTANTVLCSMLFEDILAIKIGSAIGFFVTPIAYMIYVRKHYNLDKYAPKDIQALRHRWDGFGINLAYFIHSNTDVVIITLMSSLTNVSVYAVYSMVVRAIQNLISSVSSAITPSFGKMLVEKDIDQINRSFDTYEFLITFISTVSFTCGIVLITPFVNVYTSGITDAGYHQVLFGILISIAELIYCIRSPYISAAYSAGRFKEISKYAYVEAVINIIVSIFLIRKMGLIGVAIGTVLGMTYRMVMQAIYLKKHVLHRSILKFLKMLLYVFVITLTVAAMFYKWIGVELSDYIEWIKHGALVFITTLSVSIVVSEILYKNEFNNIVGKRVINYIRHKK